MKIIKSEIVSAQRNGLVISVLSHVWWRVRRVLDVVAGTAEGGGGWR